VHHFYGTKERLFAAAMRLPVIPSEVLAAAFGAGTRDPAVSVGELLVRTALTMWDSTELRATFLGLLRSALTSEQAAAMLREFLADAILGPVAQLADGTDPAESAYRAAMVASQMVGLALTRYVLAFELVAASSVDDLAATVGPTLDRYLTGDIRASRRGPHPGRAGAPPDHADPGRQRQGKAARSGSTQPARAAGDASVADA
jgi:hypothetical protein